MCWIGRIAGTYSDVNKEKVIQTCCTDNILRSKKSLKWLVSQFHLAHYSSTNVWLFEKLVRQLCWILFPRVVRLKTELIFFFKVFWKKLIKLKPEELTKVSIIAHPQQSAKLLQPSQFDVFADCQDFLCYWKLIKIVSELVSWTGSLKFGVSLNHFLLRWVNSFCTFMTL